MSRSWNVALMECEFGGRIPALSGPWFWSEKAPALLNSSTCSAACTMNFWIGRFGLNLRSLCSARLHQTTAAVAHGHLPYGESLYCCLHSLQRRRFCSSQSSWNLRHQEAGGSWQGFTFTRSGSLCQATNAVYAVGLKELNVSDAESRIFWM